MAACKRDGQVHLERLCRQLSDARHDPHGRDGEVPRGEAKVPVHRLDGGPDRLEVGERLTHAHEHDIAELAPSLRPAAPGGDHDLFDDLARS